MHQEIEPFATPEAAGNDMPGGGAAMARGPTAIRPEIGASGEVPDLILAAGEQTVAAYIGFFGDSRLSTATRKLYRLRAGRFFRWAETRGLTLDSIDGPTLITYAGEIAAAKSPREAPIYLTPVRGVLGHLARSGFLAVDPCPKGQPNGHRRGLTSDDLVPSIIRAAGDAAILAYREFLEGGKWSPGTLKLYSQKTRRFFRWAETRGLTLETIAAGDISTYAAEASAAKGQNVARDYLKPVNGLFRHLAGSGVLSENPCEWVRAANLEKSRERPVERLESNSASTLDGFPLLDLLAMLGNMKEETLGRVFDHEKIAGSLLEQVRWADGKHCPRCGADADDDQPAQTVCQACAKPYAVTTGTMFEGPDVPLRFWFVVIHQLYFADPVLPDDELGRRFGLDMSVLLVLCRRLGEAMAREGLPVGDELKEAIVVRNRELGQAQVGRAIVEYAELEAVRNRLMQAQAQGTPVDYLPPGMTLPEALTKIEARIAEEDRYVISMKDGYLVRNLAESEPAPESAETPDA